MMQDSYAASRMENDIYSFLNVGILLCKKATGNGKVFRFVDQICLFDRIGEENRKYLIYPLLSLLYKSFRMRVQTACRKALYMIK